MVETVRMILKNKGNYVWSLPPERTVYEAITMMAEKSVGTILVMSGEQLVGIISERDYARKVILKGKLSKQTLVSEIMSSPVTTVDPDRTADECMRLMTEKRIRHLPVMDQGKLAGVVSIGDLVKAIVSVQAETIQYLSDYIGGKHTSGPIPVPSDRGR
jgi:signal-transduction protein with cAMP-binding, CBS, and nucleotidyltransferase domain